MSTGRLVILLAALAISAMVATPAAAQLRPLESMDWLAFDDKLGGVYLGVAGFRGQPVSLVGSEGRLVELGLVGVSYRSGRIVLALQGSAYRIFDASESFAEPLSLVEDPSFPRRTDSGDYRVSTAVRLLSGRKPWDAAFRFGIRLPTTNDRVGLERDQTDFFTTLAGRYLTGPLALEMEAGVAINGVAGSQFDQTDPILYGAGISYQTGRVESSIRLAGQYDSRASGPPRGNEHLSELKFGVRSLGATWIDADIVAGLAAFSPDLGLQFRVGRSF